MKIPSVAFIVAIICLGDAKDIAIAGETGSILGFEDYKECGGVLTISTIYEYVISYKEGEMLGAYEFCVWTLLPEDNVSSFRMLINQNKAEDEYGIVAYFSNSSGLTSYPLPHNLTDITFEFPPLFLALSTVNPTSNGFRITVSASALQPGKLMHQAYHVDKDEAVFSYPTKESGKDEYENNQNVSIVVQASPRDTRKRKEVTLRVMSIEEDHDFISVYTLSGYKYSEPRFRGRFSGTVTQEFAIESYDPLVFIFTSDNKVTGKGFTIELKNPKFKEL